MTFQRKIAKYVFLFGLLMNLGNYAIQLAALYHAHTDSVFTMADVLDENLEHKEKENTEKEDSKEKITHNYEDNLLAALHTKANSYPERSLYKLPVYLEYTTPPPEHI